MHDTSVVQIILLNDMRSGRVDQTGKGRAGAESKRAINQLALPGGRAHLFCISHNCSDGRMVASCDGTAQPIQKQFLGALDHGRRDVAVL